MKNSFFYLKLFSFLILLFSQSLSFATCTYQYDFPTWRVSKDQIDSVIQNYFGNDSSAMFTEPTEHVLDQFGAKGYSSAYYRCDSPVTACPGTIYHNPDGSCPASTSDYFSKGTPHDCSDGTVKYEPNQCSMSLFDYLFISPGQTKTCPDGNSVTYPKTCFDNLVGPIGEKVVEGLGLVLSLTPSRGAVKVATLAIKEAPNLLNGESAYTALRSIEYTPPSGGATKYATLEVPLTKAAIEDAVVSFGKADTPEAVAFRSQVESKTNGLYQVDPQLGLLRNTQVSDTTRPLSYAESLDVYQKFGVTASSGELSPYLRQTSANVVPQATLEVANDYSRSYINDPMDQPRFYNSAWFSDVPTVNYSTGQIIPGTSQPITLPSADVSPFSQYTTPNSKPNTSTTTGTTTTTTTNPQTGTPTTTTTQTSTTTDYGTPPQMPNYDNDYPKYFDWLKEKLPDFNNNNNDWLPQLPEPNCTYEVHTKIFGKNFDLAPCVPLIPLRQVLAWAFSILTAWLVFRLIFKSTQ